ncbi:MAG: hypothetical protein ACI8TQ_002582 [Planctomycetota bacterium]|jgi:hypothetical protein
MTLRFITGLALGLIPFTNNLHAAEVVTPAQASPEACVLIYAADDDGFGLVGELWNQSRSAPVPIPMVTRSEHVQRATANSTGLRLRFESSGADTIVIDSIHVTAMRHANDSQILIGPSDVLLVGPPTLPAEVIAFGVPLGTQIDGLPFFARQDGIGLPGPILRLESPDQLPEDHELIVIGLSAPEFAANGANVLPGKSRSARIIESELGVASTSVSQIDQLFYASTTQVDASQALVLALTSARITRGTESESALSQLSKADGDGVRLNSDDAIELILQTPPKLSSSECWTLLVSLETSSAPENGSAKRPTSTEEPVQNSELWADGWEFNQIGVPQFVHQEGPDLQLDIRPTMGPGLAIGDIEGDGDPDLYLVQGGGREGSATPVNRLLENRSEPGKFRFREVTKTSGTGHRGAGMGALFFDAEGDGDLDLFVANYGADVLYLNDGSGKFEDVTDAAGISGDRWSAGVAAADTDLDGDLDLYVTSYLVFDEDDMPTDDGHGRYQREDPTAMLPFAFPGDRNVFWRNDSWQRKDGELVSGPVQFTDITDELELADETGRGMQPIFWDFDRDGDQDLYVANDVSPNILWRNEGEGTFVDVSFTTGMDDPRGGMGVSIGDSDGDGDEDLFLSNWQLEPNALYVNNLITTRSRKSYIATFRDSIVRSKLGRYGVGFTSWGVEFLDADLDGDLDLFVANGYTSPDYESTGICVGQPNHFFLNDGEGRFHEQFDSAPLADELASRAVLACDFDRDGDPDLVITSNNGPLALLENRTEQIAPGNWVGVSLKGRGANSFGIGAEISLQADDRLLRRSMRAGSSYLAGNPPEVLFGLSSFDKAIDLSIRWPSGRTSQHRVAELNRFVTIEEPE